MDNENQFDKFSEELVNKVRDDYYEFRQFQEAAFLTLKDFHELCINHNIHYCLAYGSLLGIVRHKGQIPWDYDIDVWVPINEAAHLMEVLDTEYSNIYHYTTRFKSKKCRAKTLKIAPKKYDCEVLHVDVFWYGNSAKSKFFRNNTLKILTWAQNIMKLKYTEKKYFTISGKVSKIYYQIRRIGSFFVPAFLLDIIYNNLVRPNTNDSEWITAGFRVFPAEFFNNFISMVDSSGNSFFVPEKYHDILTNIYGDYMKVPSLDKCISDYTFSLQRLRKFSK